MYITAVSTGALHRLKANLPEPQVSLVEKGLPAGHATAPSSSAEPAMTSKTRLPGQALRISTSCATTGLPHRGEVLLDFMRAVRRKLHDPPCSQCQVIRQFTQSTLKRSTLEEAALRSSDVCANATTSTLLEHGSTWPRPRPFQ
jgi:hypothetical protein